MINFIKMAIIFYTVLLIYIISSVFIMKEDSKAIKTNFVNGSEKYLNGYRLDLPEELSTVVDNGDEGRKDTLIAYKDTISKTIYIQFK